MPATTNARNKSQGGKEGEGSSQAGDYGDKGVALSLLGARATLAQLASDGVSLQCPTDVRKSGPSAPHVPATMTEHVPMCTEQQRRHDHRGTGVHQQALTTSPRRGHQLQKTGRPMRKGHRPTQSHHANTARLTTFAAFNCDTPPPSVAPDAKWEGTLREELEWPYTVGGGSLYPPPPAPDHRHHCEKNEIYHWEYLVGPFLEHKLLGSRPPPLSSLLIHPWGRCMGGSPKNPGGKKVQCACTRRACVSASEKGRVVSTQFPGKAQSPNSSHGNGPWTGGLPTASPVLLRPPQQPQHPPRPPLLPPSVFQQGPYMPLLRRQPPAMEPGRRSPDSEHPLVCDV